MSIYIAHHRRKTSNARDTLVLSEQECFQWTSERLVTTRRITEVSRQRIPSHLSSDSKGPMTKWAELVTRHKNVDVFALFQKYICVAPYVAVLRGMIVRAESDLWWLTVPSIRWKIADVTFAKFSGNFWFLRHSCGIWKFYSVFHSTVVGQQETAIQLFDNVRHSLGLATRTQISVW